MAMSTKQEKIEAGLRTLSREKFDKLDDQERIAVVMYFADEGMKAEEIAPFVNLSESAVQKILEGSY